MIIRRANCVSTRLLDPVVCAEHTPADLPDLPDLPTSSLRMTVAGNAQHPCLLPHAASPAYPFTMRIP